MVYVDDFKLGGPKSALRPMWARLKKLIHMDEPALVGRCLGCEHHEYTAKLDGKDVRSMDYDMSSFMDQCVKAYRDVAPNAKLTKVSTPFVEPGARGHAALETNKSELSDVE